MCFGLIGILSEQMPHALTGEVTWKSFNCVDRRLQSVLIILGLSLDSPERSEDPYFCSKNTMLYHPIGVAHSGLTRRLLQASTQRPLRYLNAISSKTITETHLIYRKVQIGLR